MRRFKLQVQEDEKQPQVWRDVRAPNGELLCFDSEAVARARLAELYPVLTKMESLGVDRKRTRVLVVDPYQQDDEEKEE